ncbi:MAG: site-2 protease family protein [Bacillota bacterium]|jgi:Zn-dependent protease
MSILSWERLLFVLPSVIIALTFHESAHALVAYKFGDPTAKMQGRLTLNPLKHLDVIGTLLLIFVQFGWAKPVPINPYYFQGNRRAKMILVSIAGVSMNFILALLCAFFISLMYYGHLPVNEGVQMFLMQLAFINLILVVFNLLPIPPLDGSKVLLELLPPRWSDNLSFLDRFGFIILIILAITGLLAKFILPLINGLMNFCFAIVGLS